MSIETIRERVLAYRGGALADADDSRDHLMAARRPIKERTVSHRHPVPRRDQGETSECVGFGTAFAKQWFDWRQRGSYGLYSPRHLYQECKQIDGIPDEDGTYPRCAMKVLKSLGVCREEHWPFDPHALGTPVRRYRALSRAQRIAGYARLRTFDAMLAQLLTAGPFTAGLLLTEGWFADEAVATGVVDAADTVGSYGHLVEVLGYDAERRMFEIGNSWGTDYGDDGHNWVDREWFMAHLSDAWALYDDAEVDADLVVVKR